MARILILYYSTYGHLEAMAQAAADGVREAGGEAVVKRVPELMPRDVAEKAGAKLDQAAPIASPNELADYDGILFGAPTRFGTVAAQMRNFMDQTGGLWFRGKLIGKPGGVFTSSNTQHGGQESTILGFHTTLLHHGMVVVGLPYSETRQNGVEEVKGGSPYGASTIAGSNGERMPSEQELGMVRFQAAHLTRIAQKLAS